MPSRARVVMVALCVCGLASLWGPALLDVVARPPMAHCNVLPLTSSRDGGGEEGGVSPRLCGHRSRTSDAKLTLVVVSVFKNEADTIGEWVRHHVWQGVEHFYLVDNGSNDTFAKALAPYSPCVTVVHDATRHAQEQLLNKLLPTIQKQAEWVLSIDIDEFAYVRPRPAVTPPVGGPQGVPRPSGGSGGGGGSSSDTGGLPPSTPPFVPTPPQPRLRRHCTLALQLQALPPDVAYLSMRWRNFGSSGLVQQPPSVREFFVHSTTELVPVNKYAARTSALRALRVHSPRVWPGRGHGVDGALNNPIVERKDTGEVGVYEPEEAVVALNHYNLQSLDRFRRVKMTRGDVASATYETIRDLDYFRSYDGACKEPNSELRDLVRAFPFQGEPLQCPQAGPRRDGKA